MHTIDINCDMGEGIGPDDGRYLDASLMEYISAANIACGFHAGGATIMHDTVRLAVRHGVSVGAHPGLPDRKGFGRLPQPLTPREAYQITLYQIGALHAFIKAEGAVLHHVKPHGALYNMAAADRALAEAIAQAVADFNPQLVLYGLAGSKLIHAGRRAGIAVANEVFADRTYCSDGTLTPRSQPGSVIEDLATVMEQVSSMVFHQQAIATDGTPLSIAADTICIHGDGLHALPLAKAIHAYLQRVNVTIQPTTR